MNNRTKLSGNKEKIGTILNRDLIDKVKKRSVLEGRTISDIIQDALQKYNDASSLRSDLRKAAVNRFCSKPFNLGFHEINEILKEDYYEI